MKDIESMSQVDIRESLVKEFNWDLPRMALFNRITVNHLVLLLKYGGNKWRTTQHLTPVPTERTVTNLPKFNPYAVAYTTKERKEALTFITSWFNKVPRIRGAFVERQMKDFPDKNFPDGTTILRSIRIDRETGTLSFELMDTSKKMTRKNPTYPCVDEKQLTTQTLVLAAAFLKLRATS